MAGLSLHVLKRGAEPTFATARGSSVVDVTFGSAAAFREVRNWMVSDEETLSDHKYITMVLRHWRERLPHARSDLKAVEAIGPVLEDWVERRRGGLSFHLTQVLSGHGCFGEYLHERVGPLRDATTALRRGTRLSTP